MLMLGLITIITALFVFGCSGGGNSVATNNQQQFAGPSALTIDQAGNVPIINNMQYKTAIYVHNNSKQTISGITYDAQLNIPASSSA